MDYSKAVFCMNSFAEAYGEMRACGCTDVNRSV